MIFRKIINIFLYLLILSPRKANIYTYTQVYEYRVIIQKRVFIAIAINCTKYLNELIYFLTTIF